MSDGTLPNSRSWLQGGKHGGFGGGWAKRGQVSPHSDGLIRMGVRQRALLSGRVGELVNMD